MQIGTGVVDAENGTSRVWSNAAVRDGVERDGGLRQKRKKIGHRENRGHICDLPCCGEVEADDPGVGDVQPYEAPTSAPGSWTPV